MGPEDEPSWKRVLRQRPAQVTVPKHRSKSMLPPPDPAFDAGAVKKIANRNCDVHANWKNIRSPITVITYDENGDEREEPREQPPLVPVQNNKGRGRPKGRGRSLSVYPGTSTELDPPMDTSDVSSSVSVRVSSTVSVRLEPALMAMRTISFAMRKWQSAVIEEPQIDPNDENIDRDVRENDGRDSTWWAEVTASMEATGKDFAFDYIVACEPNQTAATLAKPSNAVLIKWAGYAVPTWLLVKAVNKKRGNSDQVNVMMKRLEVLEHVEKRLRERLQSGEAFEDVYKHRWLTRADEIPEYVTDQRAKYVNRELAFEWRMNYAYKQAYEAMGLPAPPPIYVENWLDDAPVPGMDTDLKFIVHNKPSRKVAAVLANTQEMEWVKCAKCKTSCSVPREHWQNRTVCCGVIYDSKMHYNGKKTVSMWAEPDSEDPMRIVDESEDTPGKDTRLTALEIEASMMVECVSACACNGISEEEEEGGKKADNTKTAKKAKTYCKQMVVQRGRTVSLIVFREGGEKGWGLRAGQVIAKNEFVTEYVGEIVTEHELREGSHYSFAMRYGWAENLYATDRVRNLPPMEGKNVMRRHRPFSIEATDMGNESRFINHSCEPNLVATVVYIERHGEFYHRIAFFARRKILTGEELTFDYFPGADSIRMWRAMFNECKCATKTCKFFDYDSETEDERREMKKDEDAVSIKSVDSYISDNEEYLRLDEEYKENKKKLDAKLKQKKNERRRAKARKEAETRGEESVEEEERETEKEKKQKFFVSDLRRDPMEILNERFCNDERAQETLQTRINSGGILGLFTKPYDYNKQMKMLSDAKESLARQRKKKEEVMRMEEEKEKENDRRMDVERRAPKRKSSAFEE